MMTKSLWFLLFASTTLFAQIVPSHPLVWNGTPVPKDQWSNVVAITYEEKFICSGFLVKENVVMTAAHCFDYDDFFYRLQKGTLCKERFKVHFGAGGIEGYSRHVSVADAIKDEKYNGNREVNGDDQTDYGILVLDEYISPKEATLIRPYVNSTELETTLTTLTGTGNIYSVGYGMINDQSYGKKYEVKLSYEFADDSLIYAKGNELQTGTCSGDSGSPIMATSGTGELRTIGILVSTVPNLSDNCGSLSNFVRIDKAMQWANQKLAGREKKINKLLSAHFKFGAKNAKIRNKSLTDIAVNSMIVDDSPIRKGNAYFWVRWGDGNRQYLKVSFQNALRDAADEFDFKTKRKSSSDTLDYWMNIESVGKIPFSASEEKIFRTIMDCKSDQPVESCPTKVLGKLSYDDIWNEYKLNEANLWHGDHFSLSWRL